MGVPVLSRHPMTVEEFLAFTAGRPDEERWELVAGEPVLNASPTRSHQRVLLNLLLALGSFERQSPRTWEVLPGLAVRVSDIDLPEPDVLIRPRGLPAGGFASRECDDVIVAFEVLSPSTQERDLRWKRAAYARLPSLARYVVIAQDAAEVVVFDRASGFSELRLAGPTAIIEMPELGISLSLGEIYRDVGLPDAPA